MEEEDSEDFINYGDPAYWEERYQHSQGERFDWLEDYSSLKDEFELILKGNKNARILNLGCGNGQIQDKLYLSGYHNIANNDISPAVISQMTKLNKCPQMTYEVMDATKMTYPDNLFDFVLDKSTIDALLCSDSPLVSVARMMAEVERVMKEDGVYFVVSYGEPDKRLEHFERGHVGFDLEIKKLFKGQVDSTNVQPHYLYICRKNPKKKPTKQQFTKIMGQLQKQEGMLLDD